MGRGRWFTKSVTTEGQKNRNRFLQIYNLPYIKIIENYYKNLHIDLNPYCLRDKNFEISLLALII